MHDDDDDDHATHWPLQLWIVSGWGMRNRRSAPPYRPLWLIGLYFYTKETMADTHNTYICRIINNYVPH